MKNVLKVLIIFLFISCSNEKKLPEEYGNFVIIGTSEDNIALDFFSLFNFSSLDYYNYHDDIVVKNDTLRLEIDSIGKSQFLNILMSSSLEGEPYVGSLVANPGDTVMFEIKDYQLNFIGKKAKENNFYTRLNDNTRSYIKNGYKGSLISYKQVVDSIYNEKLNFFNDYIERYDIVSEEFISMVQLEMKFRYFVELAAPRIKESSFGNFVNNYDELTSLIQQENQTNETIFELEDYFGDVKIEDLQDENYMKFHSFKMAIGPLIRHYFGYSDTTSFSKEKFVNEKSFINENFELLTREYLLANLILEFDYKGFSLSESNKEFLSEEIKDFEKSFPNSFFNSQLSELKDRLEASNFRLSKSALNTEIINYLGDTTSLESIFGRSEKRIKVINFWASWCPPCISELKTGKSFKDRLQVENNVEWIYISLEKDQQKWSRVSQEFEALNFTNSFHLPNASKTSLVKNLKVEGFPTYFIFDQNNELVMNNAPRPSEMEIFEKIIDELTSKTE